MSNAMMIPLAAVVLFIMVGRPSVAFAFASLFCACGAWIEWSRSSVGVAALPTLYAVLFAWLTFATRASAATEREVLR